MERQTSDQTRGIVYAGGAYIIWGFLPLYWKLLQHVTPEEILAQRIFWSCVGMLVFLVLMRKWSVFIQEGKRLLRHPKSFILLIIASVVISTNWFLYIWAVNNNHILETSLGYYINPLVSILLGMVVLKERLSFWQGIAVCLAAVGVIIIAVGYGSFPWIAMTLAVSFGLYGLIKKVTNFEAAIGLTLETIVITPIAFLYLYQLEVKGLSAFRLDDPATVLLLVGAGIATAVPLLLFAKGAKLIPLTMIGFLQYVAPTISLCMGVFLFKEQFTGTHAAAFGCIWAALLIFSFAKTRFMLKYQPRLSKQKSAKAS